MSGVSKSGRGVSGGERSHILCDFLLNYLFRVRISEGNMDIKICGERKANPGKSSAQPRWLRFADPDHFSKCLMKDKAGGGGTYRCKCSEGFRIRSEFIFCAH